MESYEMVLRLKDERAIDIAKRLPESERSQIIEKYIVIGDTVVRYASIVTSETHVVFRDQNHVE